MGALGWRCGLRLSREAGRVFEVGSGVRGTRDSDWIAMGRAKRVVSERKLAKAEWRSSDAGEC